MLSWPEMLAWMVGSVAVWLLFRIYTVLKAIHFMLHDEFKRKHPEVVWDD